MQLLLFENQKYVLLKVVSKNIKTKKPEYTYGDVVEIISKKGNKIIVIIKSCDTSYFKNNRCYEVEENDIIKIDY